MKQYILVRTDIEIPIGKIIAHAAHVSLAALYHYFTNPFANKLVIERIKTWFEEFDQTKIIVDGGTLNNICNLVCSVMLHEIPSVVVEDKKTHIDICGAIGPMTDEEARQFGLKDLPLYKG